MNILFLTMNIFTDIEMHNIYSDLMKRFIKQGHHPYIATPREEKSGEKTSLIDHGDYHLLKVRVGNINGVSFIKKGISTVFMEGRFRKAVKKYLSDVQFDLILYSTPPVTFSSVIKYIKARDNAKTYLLLKDIFPQNAVDIGILNKDGLKGVVYKYFRRKEKQLYAISDHIGCMSKANIDYLLKNNPYINKDKVEVCPNSIEVRDISVSDEERAGIRQKYGIPENKIVFVYGGNLGKPQDVPYIVECLKLLEKNERVFFVIAGSGSEKVGLQDYIIESKPGHVKLIPMLEKSEYDRLVACCDVGLIFLDHRFTIPNFPSRMLTYMQARLPVLAATDPVSDVGQAIIEGGFGWWCESDRPENFTEAVRAICSLDSLEECGGRSMDYLKDHYSVSKAFKIINMSLK